MTSMDMRPALVPALCARSKLKRLLDLTLAMAGLLILSPVLVLIAVLIGMLDGLPVMFRQQRYGLCATKFTILKFRTMRPGSETGSPLTHRGDPRVTALGRFLRRLSLDELPQLVNVVRGEMSLVGPRPDVPNMVDPNWLLFQTSLSARPGVTGLAQISGRDDLDLPTKLAMDADYVNHWSVALDLSILVRTLWVVLGGRGWN